MPIKIHPESLTIFQIIECFITYLYDEFKDISKSIFNPLSTEVKTNKQYRYESELILPALILDFNLL